VSTGTYTKLGLTRVVHRIRESSTPLYNPECAMEIPSDWDDLEFSSEIGIIFMFIFRSFCTFLAHGYSDVECKRRCEQREFVRHCGCVRAVPSNIHETCLPHRVAYCMHAWAMTE